jgi:hypothetical protein
MLFHGAAFTYNHSDSYVSRVLNQAVEAPHHSSDQEAAGIPLEELEEK